LLSSFEKLSSLGRFFNRKVEEVEEVEEVEKLKS
jgi:hypothetical protein